MGSARPWHPLASTRERARIPFRSVNSKGKPGYNPALQRHHLIPRQVLSLTCFGKMFNSLPADHPGFDDFRSNGLLLPASGEACMQFGLPLHRGPHRVYNELVIERVGSIERNWTESRQQSPDAALRQALMQLELLQRALRKRLLARDRPAMLLNRHDPIGSGYDFTELDTMAANIWQATETRPE